MIKKIKNTSLKGVYLIELESFNDNRGKYVETFNSNDFLSYFSKIKFVQDDISVSKKNVLRGLHGDSKTWKLVSCLFGSFQLAIVNFDPKSPQFLKSYTVILSDKKNQQVLIPPLFANGHLVLSNNAIFHYKQSTLYEGADKQFTIKWNDPKINLKWRCNKPILSQRDRLVENI